MDFRVYSCLRTSLRPFSLLFFAIYVCITTNIATAFNVTTIRFDEGYSPLFSDFNIKRSPDDKSVSLLLNRYSGSGIISTDYYNYGFFSASIKLPANDSAGIVVAFYTSNVDTFEKNHDELDIEFLGNVNNKPWRFQTNMYGKGSVSRGREERYQLWFDPSMESHRYSILWTPKNIIFYVDEVPIREIVRNTGMGGDFPSKPMSLYGTIWDASTWATNGGKVKVDYKYEPFVTEFKDLVLEGCQVDPLEQLPSTNCTDRILNLLKQPYTTITPEGRKAMKNFRETYMYYSYCYDTIRYPVPLPECVRVESEQVRLRKNGRLRERLRLDRRRRSARQRKRNKVGSSGSKQQAAI